MKNEIKFKKRKKWGLVNIILMIVAPRNEYNKTWCTFNKTVYTPGWISEDIVAHEMVHVKQQKNFFYAIWWWFRHTTSRTFRYNQELEAYRTQYRWILQNVKGMKQAEAAFKVRVSIAGGLGGPLYKWLKPVEEIMRDLEK